MTVTIALSGLSGDLVALVDDADAERVLAHQWRVGRTAKGYLIVWSRTMRNVQLSRFLLGLERGDKRIAEHWNGDPLDNRRSTNLSIATQSQNLAKAVNRGGSSIYRGVARWPNKHSIPARWQAYIRIQGRMKRLGIFDDEMEAARAYDAAASEAFGKFARLNLSPVAVRS